MNDRRRTDAQLAAALRIVTPSAAPSGSADRLAVALRATPQRRPVPFPVAPLFDADPAGRRWALLVAAALLLAAALAAATAAGAFRVWLTPHPELSLDPPADLQAYMVSVAQDSPIVRPMALTIVDDQYQLDTGEFSEQPVKERLYMDSAGDVRIERFASPTDTMPDGYRIFTPDRRVEMAREGDEGVWIDVPGPAEPRIWLFRATAAYVGVADRGCEMTELDRSAGWEYVGLEQLLGRAVHHVRCDGDFWIDAETRLVMRSRSSDQPSHTIEITSLDLAAQPAALFDTTKPDGLRTVTRTAHEAFVDAETEARRCAADPVCSSTELPLPTPAPAIGAPAPDDVDAIVARALGVRDGLPPLHLTVNHWRSKGGDAGQDRLDYVSPSRLRVEWGPDPVAGTPGRTGIAATDEEIYESHTAEGGSVTWRRLHQNPMFYATDWIGGTLLVPEPGECPDGWRLVGTDTVGAFTADHIACDTLESWVDRETGMVVRFQQGPSVDAPWVDVREVVELTFGGTPDDRFRLPDGAVLEPDPTPDPAFIRTPPPQPASGG
jgi:hypothetical protein